MKQRKKSSQDAAYLVIPIIMTTVAAKLGSELVYVYSLESQQCQLHLQTSLKSEKERKR